MSEMLMSIVSVIADILIFVVLNIEMYTDAAKMPDGQTKEWHRSPVGRLHAAGMDWMPSPAMNPVIALAAQTGGTVHCTYG